MTICIISVIRRYSPPEENSSHIYIVDVENREILQHSTMIDPPYRDRDPNPRGGLRGAKGISVRSDQIAIANGSMVFQYDPSWNLLGVISHPTCACIHDIMFENGSLWVTSPQTDLLFQFDLSGELMKYIYMREVSQGLGISDWSPPPVLIPREIEKGRIDFRDPSTHEKTIYNRSHVNSIATIKNDELLISLGFVIGGKYASLLRVKSLLIKLGLWSNLVRINQRIRSVFRMHKDMHSNLVVKPGGAISVVARVSKTGEVSSSLVLTDVTAPSHSLLPLPDGTVVYLNTTKGSILGFQPATGAIAFDIKVTEGFLRGVVLLPGKKLLLGSNEELILFDLDSKKVDSRITISEDARDSVYDIKILPLNYELPPKSFHDHFQKSTGFIPEQIIKEGLLFQVID